MGCLTLCFLISTTEKHFQRAQGLLWVCQLLQGSEPKSTTQTQRSLSGTEETGPKSKASVLDLRGKVSPGPLLLPCTALSAKSRERQSPRRFLYLSAILKVLKQKLQVIDPSKMVAVYSILSHQRVAARSRGVGVGG